jgi:hypothetical protein
LFVFTWRFTRTDAPQHFRRALQTLLKLGSAIRDVNLFHVPLLPLKDVQTKF